MMILKTLYEYEKSNTNIYDGVREYCTLEQMDEEYFRSSTRKKGIDSKYMKQKVVIAMLILFAVGLAIGCSQSESKETENGIIYESEALGVSIEFPFEWKDRYVIKESEDSIFVFSKKVYEKYPGGGLLFTISRKIGELITQEDMNQEPVTQQIILQGNGYTYFTRLPSDMQYPVNDQEVSNEYLDLCEQIPDIPLWTSLLGNLEPKAKNQGFKVVGSSFFTVEIPNAWTLKELEEPLLSWSLLDQNNNAAGVIELIPYNSEDIDIKTTDINMVKEYLRDAYTFHETEIGLNTELVDQETIEIITNSFEFAGGPYNVVDLQSNAIQYLSSGGKKVFGTIEDFVLKEDRPVAVRINAMQLLPNDFGEEYPKGYNVKDLNKIETYSLDFGVSIAPLVAPSYNTYGIYDVNIINQDFMKNHNDYKEFYYDFIIGSDGQMKIVLGRFALRE